MQDRTPADTIKLTCTESTIRLDKYIASMLKDYSREQLKSWILAGLVTVNGEPTTKPRLSLQEGDQITIQPVIEPCLDWRATDVAFDVVHEDDHILVINKPAGLVVHPGAGIQSGTVANGLLHRYPDSQHIPRAGIVHRLDKNTTGLMVIAKTSASYQALITLIKNRDITRCYWALVYGSPITGGTIDEPIGRHHKYRTQMAVDPVHGKPAVTHYRLLERFDAYATLLDCQLESGRTHQIRVHLKHIRHPIVGDPTYSRSQHIPKTFPETLTQQLNTLGRQALHAHILAFNHPITEEPLEFHAPWPDDMAALHAALQQEFKDN